VALSGVEPEHPFEYQILSLARLPIPPQSRVGTSLSLTCYAKNSDFLPPQNEPVAQLVEHRTFNAVVAGSSPARLTIKFNQLAGCDFN
jgi:hypothetical protein